jgi:hypothetical protein
MENQTNDPYELWLSIERRDATDIYFLHARSVDDSRHFSTEIGGMEKCMKRLGSAGVRLGDLQDASKHREVDGFPITENQLRQLQLTPR